MGRKTLSVSLEADRVYIRALGILAENRGITIGELTRRATDAAFGDELKPLISFFVEGGCQKDHTHVNPTNETGAA